MCRRFLLSLYIFPLFERVLNACFLSLSLSVFLRCMFLFRSPLLHEPAMRPMDELRISIARV